MNRHSASILAAGCLWGLMGFFTRHMTALGFDSPGVLIVRCGLAAIGFGLTMALSDRRLFRVRLKDIWCFLGSGLCSLLFFTYCYFQAISLMSLSAAAILLYTAPSMVMLMSLVVFRERLTARKALALIMAFCGCALVSGIGGGDERLTAAGLIYGLCSGFGYALYSIFARLALDRGYDSRTINFYSCLLAAAAACVIWGVREPVRLLFSGWDAVLWSLGTGLVSCYLPYLLYTYGLSGVEPGRASIMASLEPVVATLMGVFVYRETLSLSGAAGVALVLAAIVILNVNGRRKEKSAQ